MIHKKVCFLYASKGDTCMVCIFSTARQSEQRFGIEGFTTFISVRSALKVVRTALIPPAVALRIVLLERKYMLLN
jgi:hypothetical protein